MADAEDGGPSEKVPPVALDTAAVAADTGAGRADAAAAGTTAAAAAPGPPAGGGEEAPHTPQVSSKHWRKIRSAVVALAAFRSRRVRR